MIRMVDVLLLTQHTLGIGDVEIMTYNGKVFFSSDSWAGRVVSYYDPRII